MPSRSESVWYIIKPTAHEGPYSFEQLEHKLQNGALLPSSLIWARGWPEAVEYYQLQKLFETQVRNLNFEQQSDPKILESFEDMPYPDEPLEEVPGNVQASKSSFSSSTILSLVFIILGLSGGMVFYHLKQKPVLERPQRVSVTEFREVKTLFDNTESPIPLPLLLNSQDFKKISMVDRSSQNCSFSINFFSDTTQNLSQQRIAFTAQAQSHQHWVIFDRFEFRDGQRIVPGHYEINIQRSACRPLGWKKILETNDRDLSLNFKQSFFTSSLEDLEKSLALLEKKKMRESQRAQLASLDTWKEINEKFRTLRALSSQISNDFQKLLDRRVKWPERVKNTLNEYTLRYGSFLTGFLDSNEGDFKRIAELEIPMKQEILGRLPLIVGFAQRIGLVSSQLLEKINQKGVVPNRIDLEKWLKEFNQSINLEASKLTMAMDEVEVIIKNETASLEAAQSR